MESWIISKSPKGELFLKNRSRTLIRFSRRVDVDIGSLMAEMRRLRVPFAYSDKVKEIYFTITKENHGYHLDGNIKIAHNVDSRKMLPNILVHEIAHDVDDHEGLSEREDIVEEKRRRARFMSDTYARTDAKEYVACGFETFYCGTPERKAKMRRHNPKLYGAIRYLHRKYRSR